MSLVPWILEVFPFATVAKICELAVQALEERTIGVSLSARHAILAPTLFELLLPVQESFVMVEDLMNLLDFRLRKHIDLSAFRTFNDLQGARVSGVRILKLSQVEALLDLGYLNEVHAALSAKCM